MSNAPAGYEEDDRQSPGTARVEWFPTAEAAASDHYQHLTCHQKQESSYPEPSRYIGIVYTVIVVHLTVLHYSRLKVPTQIESFVFNEINNGKEGIGYNLQCFFFVQQQLPMKTQ